MYEVSDGRKGRIAITTPGATHLLSVKAGSVELFATVDNSGRRRVRESVTGELVK